MRNAWIWIVAIVLLLAGGFMWWQSAHADNDDLTSRSYDTDYDTASSETAAVGSSSDQVPTDTSTTTQSGGVQTYTAAVVQTHKDATSCWSIIDNNVYDLTSWISKHPGGRSAILGICGKDGTAAFHGQHDDAKRQADMLATMKIGVLTK